MALVDPLAAYLAGVPSRVRAAVRLALWALERSAFPRGFSRLSLERRAARLERLERGRTGMRRDLFLLLKTLSSVAYTRDPRVQAAVGSRGRCALSDGRREVAREAPPLEAAALDPRGDLEHCDVAVVGSGAGGAAVARAVAERGLSVLVLEQGGYHDASSYSTDPLVAPPRLYRDAGLTVCEGRPAIPLPLGRCVGGTTVMNSGTCFRAPAPVLQSWRDRFGIGWATELEAEFESVERDLRVAPVDPATAGRNAALCRAGAEALGASNGPIARNAGDVTCCGTCPTGCALDAKQAMHVSELPRAARAGARVRANCRVERVLLEAGRAVGVECRLATGARYEVRARAVVMAAGAIGTAELLLSQGLGNSSGALGRHLHIHPACWVGALFDEEVRGWDGVMQSWYVDEWSDRGLLLEATFTPLPFGAHWLPGTGAEWKERIERYGRIAVIGVHLSDRSHGRVRMRGRRARIRYRLTRDEARTIGYGIARAADIHFAAGAREVYPQIGSISRLRPGEQEGLARNGRVKPADLHLEAFHPMGTARMGSDARASVVGPSGESHDVPGLYVADASIFPTSLGVNPMITIMACARRIAAGVARRLG